MAIENLVNKAGPFEGDGSTRNWPYLASFDIILTSDITVWLVDPAGTITQITSNYSVDTDLGEVIYPTVVSGLAPIAEGYQILLVRTEPITQLVDLETQGSFNADVIEAMCDKLTMICQQLQEQLARCIKFPIDETPSEDDTEYFLILITQIKDAAVTAKNAAVVAQGLAEAARNTANADVVLTHADVLLTHADVVLTHADAVQTALDRIATGEDRVQTGLDKTQTGLDKVATNADVVLTHADVVLTHADVVLTHADVVSTHADATQTALDRIATGSDKTQTGLDAIATAADRVQTGLDAVDTGADAIATAADRVQTGLDKIDTAADRVQTGLDKTQTGLDKIATNADVITATNAKNDAVSAKDNAVIAKNAAESAQGYAEAARDLAQTYAAALKSTSTSSLAIGTGSKTFVTQAGKQFAAGQYVIAVSDANSANYMHGQVTSYSGTSLVINVIDIGGSGTLADWTISLSGSRGAVGATGAAGSMPIATAAGSVDAITADFTPDITLADMIICAIVASGANTSTTPTFAPDGLTAHTIVKKGGSALVAGDIPGAGAVCILEYNLASTRWELLNPAASSTAPSPGTTVRYVGPSGQYTTIQAAIDAASAGDTILVAPGTYAPFIIDLDNLTIKAMGDKSNTIITDATADSIIQFNTHVGTVIEGFTISVTAVANVTYGVLRWTYTANTNPTIIRNCDIIAIGSAANSYTNLIYQSAQGQEVACCPLQFWNCNFTAINTYAGTSATTTDIMYIGRSKADFYHCKFRAIQSATGTTAVTLCSLTPSTAYGTKVTFWDCEWDVDTAIKTTGKLTIVSVGGSDGVVDFYNCNMVGDANDTGDIQGIYTVQGVANIYNTVLDITNADNDGIAINLGGGSTINVYGGEIADGGLTAAGTLNKYSLTTEGDLYIYGNCSALTYTDRTPYYEGDALNEIVLIKGKDGKIDHSTLPSFVRKTKTTKIQVMRKVEKTVKGRIELVEEPTGELVTQVDEKRDLGAMISMLTVAVQQLNEKIKISG